MKRLLLFGAAATLPLFSPAQVLVNDNFDSYADQAAFVAGLEANKTVLERRQEIAVADDNGQRFTAFCSFDFCSIGE